MERVLAQRCEGERDVRLAGPSLDVVDRGLDRFLRTDVLPKLDLGALEVFTQPNRRPYVEENRGPGEAGDHQANTDRSALRTVTEWLSQSIGEVICGRNDVAELREAQADDDRRDEIRHLEQVRVEEKVKLLLAGLRVRRVSRQSEQEAGKSPDETGRQEDGQADRSLLGGVFVAEKQCECQEA